MLSEPMPHPRSLAQAPFDWAQDRPFGYAPFDYAQDRPFGYTPFGYAQGRPFGWAQDRPFGYAPFGYAQGRQGRQDRRVGQVREDGAPGRALNGTTEDGGPFKLKGSSPQGTASSGRDCRNTLSARDALDGLAMQPSQLRAIKHRGSVTVEFV